MTQPAYESFSRTRDNLLYGDHPVVTRSVVIGASQTIERGQLLGRKNRIVSLAQAGATWGNVTLTLLGKTTGNIAFNAAAADVKTAIVAALADLGFTSDDIDAAGGALGSAAVVLQFKGRAAGQTVDITVTDVDLDAGAVTATDTSAGAEGQYVASDPAATDEQQEPLAILSDDAVTTGVGETAQAIAYEAGHFNSNAVEIGDHELGVVKNILRPLGIHLHESSPA